MDRFFTQETCDRCGGSLKSGRIMSMYNEECICMVCKDKEREQSDYKEAVEAEHEQIKKGNYKGIKG
ncbi:gamma-glutamylcyclotransferase [Haloimpatiens sp. FM7315]|uniref:gamma-glutamylcyclotransferase n=1 Tax=Haloimpatiens sp. FM7315 TaxID=3298609 RepID=UPI0035A2DDF3